jgi:hypothetical protein
MAWWWGALALLVACNPGKDAQSDLIDPTPHDYQREANLELARLGQLVADFRDDLAAERLAAAYARLAPMTQAAIRPEDLAALAKHPAFAAGVRYTVYRSSVTNGLATATGQLAGPTGTARLELRCTAVHAAWKLAGISIDGAVVLPAHGP